MKRHFIFAASPLRRFAASPLRRFAASLLFFLLSSHVLTAQCVGNPRIDIAAVYSVNETDAGVPRWHQDFPTLFKPIYRN